MTEVVYSERAAEQIEKLEKEDGERIVRKLEEAREWPDHFLEPLKGGFYKLRAGEYRAIVNWKRDRDELFVKAVRHRRNIYDREL